MSGSEDERNGASKGSIENRGKSGGGVNQRRPQL